MRHVWRHVGERGGRHTTPREGSVRLPDGRRLAFLEVGATDGNRAVFSFHGGLSCRLEVRFADAFCRRLGIRLIAPDRPGIGRSDFQLRRRLVDWASDVAQLAEALDIGRFAICGWSAGAPYALACARFLSQRIRAAAVVGGLSPLDRADLVSGLGLWVDRLLFPLCRRAPRLGGWLLDTTRFLPRSALKRLVVHSLERAGDPDALALTAEAIEGTVDCLVESLARGGVGTAYDYRLLGLPWGFELREIHTEVTVWHGECDALVPPEHAWRLAARLARARVRLVPGRGHFLPRWCLEGILTELLG